MTHGNGLADSEDSSSPHRDRCGRTSSALVAAACSLSGESPPIHFGRSPGRTLGLEREGQITRLGLVPEFDVSALGVEIVKGGEHEVYWSEDKSMVHKVTFADSFGYIVDELEGLSERTFLNETRLQLRPALPSEYMIRWAILDEVFGVQTHFDGLLRRSRDEFSFVISQRFVGDAPGRMPTWEETEAFMTSFGFFKVDPNLVRTREVQGVTWYRQRDGVLITDALPRNFRIEAGGAVMPIDLVVNIVPPGASRLLPPATEPFSLPKAQ